MLIARDELLHLPGRLLSLQCGSIEGLWLAGSPFPEKKKAPTGLGGVALPQVFCREMQAPVPQSGGDCLSLFHKGQLLLC